MQPQLGQVSFSLEIHVFVSNKFCLVVIMIIIFLCLIINNIAYKINHGKNSKHLKKIFYIDDYICDNNFHPTIEGDVNNFIKKITENKVSSFKSIEPDLEEIFLSFYKKRKRDVK